MKQETRKRPLYVAEGSGVTDSRLGSSAAAQRLREAVPGLIVGEVTPFAAGVDIWGSLPDGSVWATVWDDGRLDIHRSAPADKVKA